MAQEPSGIAAARRAIVWNARTGEKLQTLEHPENVSSVTFSPDGEVVVTVSGTVLVWDIGRCELIKTLPAEEGSIDQVVFSPDGASLLGYSQARTGSAIVWEMPSGRELFEIPLKQGAASGEFSTDGSQIILNPSLGCAEPLRVYPTDPLAAGREALPRELTTEEREFYGIQEEDSE
jgi:WD40 repeat protein